jgi:two-component system chemotaxis sensor kinase CheA
MNAMDREAFREFREESLERLDRIAGGLADLAGAGTAAPELLHELFRETHSLKSGASLLPLKPVETLCHKLEDILSDIRSGRDAPDQALIEILSAGFSRVRAFLESPHVLPLVDVSRDLAEIDRRLMLRNRNAPIQTG